MQRLSPLFARHSARYFSPLLYNSIYSNQSRQLSYILRTRSVDLLAAYRKTVDNAFSCRYVSLSRNLQSASAKRDCWSCGTQTDSADVRCGNTQCKAIQPVGSDVTYYDVLLSRQAPSFNIDMGLLRRNFLKIQQLVHPDSFSQMGDSERRLAEAQSSWVNHAYATLKDPLLRAFYMLELKGEAIGEEDQISDPELLMEIMELREEIEASKADTQIAAIKERNDLKIANVTAELSAAFDAEDYDSAKQLAHHLQYLHRVAQTIHNWEPGKPVIISH